jgi:hypothetical protein
MYQGTKKIHKLEGRNTGENESSVSRAD